MSAVGSGLVGQVTTQRPGHLSVSEGFRDMNSRRRFRRMRRVVIGSADASRAAVQSRGERARAVLVTLTYRKEAAWASSDVRRYIDCVRKYLLPRRHVLRYQWVIELTQAGRPHYHVLFWLPPRVRLPKPDQHGQWTKGLSRIEAARRPVGYLVKYATKGTDGELPKGARLFGVGDPAPEVRFQRHRLGLPTWLNDSASEGELVRRVSRVGWVERGTGLIHQSPFRLRVSRDSWGCVVIEILSVTE